MKAFADLYAELDSTTKTNEKVDALKRYFMASDPADSAWAVHFLIGRRPKRLIETRKLVERAKGILQRDLGLTEEQAYLSIQRQSRQKRKTMKEVAEAIVLSEEVRSSSRE